MTVVVERPTRAARNKRVARVKGLYPESFLRVRSVCRFAAFGFDLDDHAAGIVLAAHQKDRRA